MMVTLLLVALVCEGQPSTSPMLAPADRWTQFRGTTAMSGNTPVRLPAKLELLWRYDTRDSIEATAAIADGVIYIPTMDGRLLALGLRDGKEKWVYQNADKDGSKSSPCLANDMIVYGDMIGVIRAIHRETGMLAWSHDTGAEIVASPSFVGGRVLIGSYDESLYCFEPAKGKVLWSFRTRGPVHCSPTLVGDQIVVAGCDGVLRLIDQQGVETKSLEMGGNQSSTPAAWGHKLYFGTMEHHVVCIDSRTMNKEWTYEHRTRHFAYVSSPALTSDLVIIGGRDKMAHGLEIATGKERWTFATKGKIDGSPVVAGDRVYFGSADANLYGLESATGKKVWEFRVSGGVLASPAIADGCLVIGDDAGMIYCFGQK